ncbi:hypothetical protein GC089_02655 [Cellulomonas sp. JZ18]|uniref:preATP grasp domain-containing protein n=1 Tax=Cellulomonas sp. JZ18 TaxID=2654191 RepID=UPI0012D47DFA|nr:hypothetical protein [Cellulomonas sp. JZ18]QGQ18358.1 hypothetical protein GC089_02655 [Cellulomonas sp. JZ18]
MTAERVVHLGNFDVEEQWAAGDPGLPAPTVRSASAVTAAAGELALLVAADGHTVVVKHRPEEGLLAQHERLGFGAPEVLVAGTTQPDRPVTLDVLGSPATLDRLRERAAEGARLAPHGFSAAEDELCAVTGLRRPVAADVAAVKRINGKVFSRRLTAELGLPRPQGWECETVDELQGLAARVRAVLEAGRAVGLKSSWGVSGKGIMVCEDVARFDQLVRLLTRRAERSGDHRFEAVLEVWQDKRTDLNYHFTIEDDGRVRFDFVLEAITEDSTHRGHRLPDRGDPRLREQLVDCAERIGARLADEGYRGPVGVDAIVCQDGTLFPVLEINARNNMSTYLTGVQTRLRDAGSVGAAVQIDLSLAAPLRHEEVERALQGLLLRPDWRDGFLVTCSASLNASAAWGKVPFRGRLHGVAVGPDDPAVADLARTVQERLEKAVADRA